MSYKDLIKTATKEAIVADVNSAIKGSGSLQEGKHLVKIEAVELIDKTKEGNEVYDNGEPVKPKLALVFTDANGDSIRNNLYLLKKDGQPFNFMYHGFITALTSLSAEIKADFARNIIVYPEMLKELIGMQLYIEVKRKPEGYIILQAEETKKWFAKDIKSGDILTDDYSNYKELKEAIASYNDNPLNVKLQMASNEVKLYRSYDERSEEQDKKFIKVANHTLEAKATAKPATPTPAPRRSI